MSIATIPQIYPSETTENRPNFQRGSEPRVCILYPGYEREKYCIGNGEAGSLITRPRGVYNIGPQINIILWTAGKLEEASRSTNGKSSLRPGICRIWSLASQHQRKYLCRKVLSSQRGGENFNPGASRFIERPPSSVNCLFLATRRKDTRRENVGKHRTKTMDEKVTPVPAGFGRQMRRDRDQLDHSRSDKLFPSPSFSLWESLACWGWVRHL